MAVMAQLPVVFSDIAKACERIAPYLQRTPVFTSNVADEISGESCFSKQRTCRRPALSKHEGHSMQYYQQKKDNQHSKALSPTVMETMGKQWHGHPGLWASPCSVVLPAMAPASKKAAISGYGAQLMECGAQPTDRYELCEKLQRETGYMFIPPYDHRDVIAGQGTIAVELLDQVPDLDAIIVPISGGGLASGIAVAAKHIKPSIKVFVASPKGKMLTECFKTGKRLWPNPPEYLNTIADAIRTQQLGQLTFAILAQLAEKETFEMSDEEMLRGIKFVMHRMKLVVELAAGASVAAGLSARMKSMDPTIHKVAIILCGGNIDLDHLPW